MNKYGLEVEFFGTKNGKLINCSAFDIPHDEYPLLAEARGSAFACMFQAVASVRGEIDRITHLMLSKGIKPLFIDWQKKDSQLDEDILREGFHKRIAYRNLANLEASPKNKDFISAGLHISVTNTETAVFDTKRGRENFFYNRAIDFPYYFNRITKEFLPDIRKAERVENFYEVKPDGRVEYRSLPATIIHSKNFATRLASCFN